MIDDHILKFEHKIDQRATALADDMVRELRASKEAILGRLAALAGEFGRELDDLPLSKRKAFYEAQAASIDGVLAEVYAKAGDHLREAGEDVIGATMTSTATAMAAATGGAAVGVGVGVGLTTGVVEAWFKSSTVSGLTINDFLAKIQAGARDRIVSAGRRALIEGMSVQKTAKLIQAEGIEGSVPGLEGLARTFLHSASNHARDQIVKDKFADIVTGWQRLATLDGRTCPVCGAADGKVYGLNDPKPVLPEHWRCRCCYVMRSKTWRELGIDVDEMEEGDRTTVKHSSRTVHHRDGSTSTKFKVREVGHVAPGTTYEIWLRQQLDEDPAFVRSVLGKARFDLFKAGKLSLSSMVTNGRIKRFSPVATPGKAGGD